jgi:hypothetical protein
MNTQPLDRLDWVDRLHSKDEQARAMLLAMKGGYSSLNDDLQNAYVQTLLDLLSDIHEATTALLPNKGAL